MNILIALPLAVFLVFLLRKAWSFFGRSWTSPLRFLPGPKSPSFIYGHIKEIFLAESSVPQERWALEYGKTFKYYGIGNAPRLFTMDTRALAHILAQSEIYQKPEVARASLAQILGDGVLVVEGAKHRQQRRIMNPAFGPNQLRALTTTFHQKSIELRDVLLSQVPSNDSDRAVRVDIMSWLSHATLDMIGLAGFGYSFNALTSADNELSKAFEAALRVEQKFSIFPLLQAAIPVLRHIPTERKKEMDRSRSVMRRIGYELLEDRKMAAEMNTGKDLLSLLVKANIADKDGMSDEDVIAQVPTFLVAGHETTATATTWALYSLSLNPDIQKKLREELLNFDSEVPTMDEIKTFTYLDWVVKETLRVHSPVPGTTRIATRDDVIPMEDGSTIRVGKGDPIFIGILAMNRSKEMWGEDSFEFKPERWSSLPDNVSSIPGIWGHLLSFLGGPRACIGYQFSILEMKCLLFTLIRSFEFSLAVPEASIVKKSSIVQKPFIKGEEEKGTQMPLVVKIHVRA